MTYAVKIFIISCLLQGSLCQTWEVIMPLKVQGLAGSCVAIPCTFTMPPSWDKYLDDSCRALWQRGWTRSQVFDSSLTGASASTNVVQGNLTGNLKNKDCTTVFKDLPSGHRYNYYFRLSCDGSLKFNFAETVDIDIQDSLPEPTITPSPFEVDEGTPSSLSCSAPSPCPALPPVLTWKTMLVDAEESVENGSLTASFSASYRHNEQNVTCSASYSRQNGGSDYLSEKTLTLRVLYAPYNTSVSYSGPVEEGSPVTLNCTSSANPAVDNFIWYKKVGDEATPVGFTQQFSTTASEAEREFYCTVNNGIGNQTSAIAVLDVLFPPKDTSVSIDPPGPTTEGSSISMLCSSRANPAVTDFTWYKGNVSLEETGSVLALRSVDLSQAGGYHCEAKNYLGVGTSATFELDVQYPPKNTSLQIEPSGSVPDGSTVTLTCKSVANPGSIQFTWYRVTDGEKEMLGSGKQIKLNVTKLSENQYMCKAANVHGDEDSEPILIDVTFSPEILTSSRCIKISSQIRCTCDAEGNPPPSMVWEYGGMPVNHSDDIPIREIPIDTMVRRSTITFYGVDNYVTPLVCFGTNELGTNSYTFNVSSSEQSNQTGLHPLSVVIGCAVGAVIVLVLCAPVLFFCRRRRGKLSTKEKPLDSSVVAVTNETNSSGVAIYSNKAIIEREEQLKEDQLHYANLDFNRLEARSGGKAGRGEIRNLYPKTEDYAEVVLNDRGRNGREAANALAEQQPDFGGHTVNTDAPF